MANHENFPRPVKYLNRHGASPCAEKSEFAIYYRKTALNCDLRHVTRGLSRQVT